MDVMKLMVEVEEGGESKIFHDHPHPTCDNFTSVDSYRLGEVQDAWVILEVL